MRIRSLLCACVAIVLAAVQAGANHRPEDFAHRGTILVPTPFERVLWTTAQQQLIYPDDCNEAGDTQGVVRYFIELPEDSAGHPFSLEVASLADADVYFITGDCGAITGASTGNGGAEIGTIPLGTTWAEIILHVGAATRFDFLVSGVV